MTSALLAFIKLLLGLFGRPNPTPAGSWRSLDGEPMAVPFGKLYERAGFHGRVGLLHACLRPWAGAAGSDAKQKRRTGRVSGVYYPID